MSTRTVRVMSARGTRPNRGAMWALPARCRALPLAFTFMIVAASGLWSVPAWSQTAGGVAAAGRSAAQVGDADAGRTAYAQSGCGACHGAEGGGSAAGPSLTHASLTPEAFVAFVRRPVRSMPAYPADAIPDRVLIDLYAYLEQAGAASLPAGQPERGAQLFVATGCFQCHANQAQGGMHGPRIGPDPISWPRFAWYVRHPSATMPPYTEQVLPDAALRDVYAFLEALPRPPDLSRIPLLAP
jgi:mono/diheme cytochrome c family protein